MDRRFITAFSSPASVRILGKRLYPFCLKHRVRLLAIRSPMVTSTGQGIGPRDLLTAVKVCAEDGDMEPSIFELARLKALEINPAKMKAAVEAFVAYCHIDAWPKYWDAPKTSGSADGAGVPWPLMILTNLIANGIEEQRAWEMPEAQAIWLSTAFAMRGGAKVNLLTTEEEELMDELRRGELPPQQG